jgi:hypothetical protein
MALSNSRTDVGFSSNCGVRADMASHALAGRADEARRAMDRLRQLDPALRISNLRDLLPRCIGRRIWPC